MQKRRIIAVLITLILMVSVFSISAFATDLTGLTISDASSIEPDLTEGVYDYTVNIPADINTVTVDATVDPTSGATVVVNGADDIAAASNVISIVVTDKDGKTTQNYTINVEPLEILAAPTTTEAQAQQTSTMSNDLSTIPVWFVGLFLLLIVLAFGIGYLIAHGVTKSKYEDVEQPSSMPIIPQSQNKIRLTTTSDFGKDSHRATGHQIPRPVANNKVAIPAEKELSKKEQKKLEKQKAQEEKLRLKQQQELEARLAKEHEEEEKAKLKQAKLDAKLEAKAAKKNKNKKVKEVEKPAEIPVAAPMPVPSFVQGIDEPVISSNPAPIPEVEPIPEIKIEAPVVETPVEPAIELPVEPAIEAPVEPTIELPVEPAIEAPVEPTIDLPVEPTVEAPVEPAFELPTAPEETKIPSFTFTRPDDFVMGSADDVELSEKDKKRIRKKEEEEAKKAEEKEQKKKKSIFAKKSSEVDETAAEEEDDFEGWQEEIPDSLAGFGFTAAAKLSDEFVQSADD